MKSRAQVGRFLNTASILDPEIKSRVRRYIGWARSEMGEDPTSGQIGLLAALRLCLTVVLLAERDMVKADWDARPLMKTLNAYVNSFRQIVTALGLLQRRGQGPKGGRKKPPDLASVVEHYSRKGGKV